MTTLRFGRRGASLIIYGLIWFLSGLSLLILPIPSEIQHVLAIHVWAAVFLVSGVVACLASAFRTPRTDRWGFIALTLSGSLWAAYCATTWVLSLFNPLIFSPGWVETLTDILLMVKITVDAGWSEPTTPVALKEVPNVRRK